MQGLCALVAVGVTIAPHPVGATELGGNYNQYICDIYNGLVTKSGAKWVRAFARWTGTAPRFLKLTFTG